MIELNQVEQCLEQTEDNETKLFLREIKEFIRKRDACDEVSTFSHDDHWNHGWNNYIERLVILKTALDVDEINGLWEVLFELMEFNNLKNPRIYYNLNDILEEWICKKYNSV